MKEWKAYRTSEYKTGNRCLSLYVRKAGLTGEKSPHSMRYHFLRRPDVFIEKMGWVIKRYMQGFYGFRSWGRSGALCETGLLKNGDIQE